ncbi:hypothetical protein BGZ75_008243 [Mortierella antarctica]|nr:hypothetical protein BGZ75_008243 [Mortierella antarctica]
MPKYKEKTSTEPCIRNRGGDACPIYYAMGPKTKDYYTGKCNRCIACNQIYSQLKVKNVGPQSDVGNVSRPIFNRGMAEVRAQEYRPDPPSNRKAYYLALIKEVIAFALEPEVDDTAFETRIAFILEREAPPIDSADDDEESEGSRADKQVADKQVAEEQETDKQVADMQVADKQDEAEGSERPAHISREAVILETIKTITDRQADDATRMLGLIAELRLLSVGK